MSVKNQKKANAALAAKFAAMRQKRNEPRTEGQGSPFDVSETLDGTEDWADEIPALDELQREAVTGTVIMFFGDNAEQKRDGAYYRSALIEFTVNQGGKTLIMTGTAYVRGKKEQFPTVAAKTRVDEVITVAGAGVVFAKDEQFLHLTKTDEFVVKTAKRSTILGDVLQIR